MNLRYTSFWIVYMNEILVRFLLTLFKRYINSVISDDNTCTIYKIKTEHPKSKKNNA